MGEESNYIFLKVFFCIVSLICLILYQNIFIYLISIPIALKFNKRINIYIIILYILSIFISGIYTDSKYLISVYDALFYTIKILSIIVLIKDIIIPLYKKEKIKLILLNILITILLVLSLFNYNAHYKNKFLIGKNTYSSERNTYYGKAGYFIQYESDEGNIESTISGFYFDIPLTNKNILVNGWISINKIIIISNDEVKINNNNYMIKKYETTKS